MKFTKLALTLLGSMVLFCACAKNSDVLIKVNDEAITRAEYYADFDRIKEVQFKDAPAEYKKEGSYNMAVFKERYTNDVIVRKLLAQEFEKRKIVATKEEIDAKKKSMEEQIGSKEQLQKLLKDNHISEERFTKDMESEVQIEKLIEALGGAKVTDKDAQDFYNKNKEQFNSQGRAQVSHILIDTNPESIKKKLTEGDNKSANLSAADLDKKVAEEIKRKEALVKEITAKVNPKNFAELAKQYSEDTGSAQRGGDLGYVEKEQLVPEFAKAAFTQKVGVVGPVVKSQFGEHIILVKDRTAAGLQPFSKVKEDLKRFLVQQKKGELIQNFVEGVKSKSKIEYFDKSLEPETLKKASQDALQKQLKLENVNQKPVPNPQAVPQDKK